MCRLTLSSAIQSLDFHWRCDYSFTTPARPDLGSDPQRPAFSGIGCGKETVNPKNLNETEGATELE